MKLFKKKKVEEKSIYTEKELVLRGLMEVNREDSIALLNMYAAAGRVSDDTIKAHIKKKRQLKRALVAYTKIIAKEIDEDKLRLKK